MAREQWISGLRTLAAAIVLLVAGTAIGWWLHPSPQAAKPAAPPDRQVLYWYDPMVPQQHFDKPGKSPFMDMQLVPRYADEQVAPGITVSSATQQTLGIRLATVERIEQRGEFEAAGVLAYNEREVAIVHARAAGFVQSVRPLASGDRLAAGELIAELVIPDWTAAEQDWLIVRSSGDVELTKVATDRLRALGIDDTEIRRLEMEGSARRSFGVRAPRGGVLQALEIRQGMTVSAGQTLARINDTRIVWLDISVPESFASSVRPGDRVVARSLATPSLTLEGQVSAVLPALDSSSRALPVRVELGNPRGQLRPGQPVQVTLTTEASDSAVAVPTEAVIRTGRRTLVMLSDNGTFRPVEVTLGSEMGDRTIIASGLEAGQQVVASGQFLLDSEASLRGLGPPAMEDQP